MPNKNQEAATIWPTIWQILLLKIDLARNQAKASSEFQMGPVDESPLPIVKIARRTGACLFFIQKAASLGFDSGFLLLRAVPAVPAVPA
jgi:hypothetical protein